MSIKRIVSFLPSATELLYEFGIQDHVFGVTHECKYPPDATLKPQVIDSVINSKELSSKNIDRINSQLLKEGKDIFVINETNLKNADPDLIITQDTCKVCSADTSQVKKALHIIDNKNPIIHSMDPHNLNEIIDSVTDLGKILNMESKAKEITRSLKVRIQNVQNLSNKQRPKVLAIEWIDPFYTAGHWIPEIIELAGGDNLISKTGEISRRVDINEIIISNPDIIILMPCGFDTHRTIVEYSHVLKNNKSWNSIKAVNTSQVFAVDANSFFSKPSIRTIEGLEIIAKIIQPNIFKHYKVPESSFKNVTSAI